MRDVNERIVGRIPVLESLRAGKRRARRLYLLRGAKGLEAIREAARGVPIEEIGRGEFDRLVGGVVHQGVVLDAAPLPLERAEDWVRRDFAPDAAVVILDGIEDPHNFGAIVRSAAGLGAAGVVFLKDRAAPISPVSVKSAAGAMEHIDLVAATNLARAIEGFKQAGFWVAGLDAAGEQTLWEADLGGRVALVVGGEGKGLRRLTRERCDFLVRIPLAGAITSLNASVSVAIALTECRRRRLETPDRTP